MCLASSPIFIQCKGLHTHLFNFYRLDISLYMVTYTWVVDAEGMEARLLFNSLTIWGLDKHVTNRDPLLSFCCDAWRAHSAMTFYVDYWELVCDEDVNAFERADVSMCSGQTFHLSAWFKSISFLILLCSTDTNSYVQCPCTEQLFLNDKLPGKTTLYVNNSCHLSFKMTVLLKMEHLIFGWADWLGSQTRPLGCIRPTSLTIAGWLSMYKLVCFHKRVCTPSILLLPLGHFPP